MNLLSFKLSTFALIIALSVAVRLPADEPVAPIKSQPLILAHYMPWFEIKSMEPRWGWHWTMNHFDPEQQSNGKRNIASHYYPLIGPYDSSDVKVIDYHLQTMKLAGIDGVIVDWYGLTDFRDYALLHRATTRVLEQCEKLQMKFVICYEDQTIPALVDAKRLSANDRVTHAANELTWLGKYWFKSPSYVYLEGKPLLLSFGQSGLTDDEWTQCLGLLSLKIAYVSQHHRRSSAAGSFDWPIPKEGLTAFDQFITNVRDLPIAIPVAFPRFVDIYEQAKVAPSYGQIADEAGKTFEITLESSLESGAPIIQLATWNDWGEGTQIEPSVEFGFRDLETVQRLRKKWIDPSFPYVAEDLKSLFRQFETSRSGKE